MTMLRCLPLLVIALGLAGFVGCDSGPRYVKVGGTIKLDGQPYPNAMVSFQPTGNTNNPNPGRGSSAYTDANGHFDLVCMDGTSGAVPGKHVVRIQTRRDKQTDYDPTKGSPDGIIAKKGVREPKEAEPIPVEWYGGDGKEFTVPPGGTDEANFDIDTKRKKGN